MQLIRGLHNLSALARRGEVRPRVLTIGNFDGVHLGHQQIVQQVKGISNVSGLPSSLMLFEPQPLEFFAGDHAPPRLTRFAEKVRLLGKLELDELICLHFNDALRSLKAEEFVTDILLDLLRVKHLVIGDDFHFGYRNQGDFDLLKRMSAELDFEVTRTDSYLHDSVRVSSTAVREALADGGLDQAASMLGRTYSISGRVKYGRQLAAGLGMPTANLALQGLRPPLQGVFAVEVQALKSGSALGDQVWQGVANLGVRPTVSGRTQVLEVHVFDFDSNLYGEHIEVVFRQPIREEKTFAGLDELREQMHRDMATAKAFFANN